MNRRRFVGVTVGALLLAGCSLVDPDGESASSGGTIVSGTGTVRRLEIEGGFFAIVGDDKATYDPINLPAEFQRDGLRVRFRARLHEGAASFHMVGPLVELLEISRL